MDKLILKTNKAFTLVELVVVMAILVCSASFALSIWNHIKESRMLLASRFEASSLIEQLGDRFNRIARSRTNLSSSDTLAGLSCDKDKKNCVEINRFLFKDSKKIKEKFRFKNVCIPLSDDDSAGLLGAEKKFRLVSSSLASFCKIMCPDLHRPAILLESLTTQNTSTFKNQVFPEKTRFGFGKVVSAGFCINHNGVFLSSVRFAVAYAKQSSIADWRIQIVDKEIILPKAEDFSEIEWLP